MTEKTMYREELRQIMEVAVSTYLNLNGTLPEIKELYAMLGREYAPVIAEYAGQVEAVAG